MTTPSAPSSYRKPFGRPLGHASNGILALVALLFLVLWCMGAQPSWAATSYKVTFSGITGGSGSVSTDMTVGSLSSEVLPEENVLYLPSCAPTTLSYSVTFPSTTELETQSLVDAQNAETMTTVQVPVDEWAAEVLMYGVISSDGATISYGGQTYAYGDLYTSIEVPATSDTSADTTGGTVITIPLPASASAASADASKTAGSEAVAETSETAGSSAAASATDVAISPDATPEATSTAEAAATDAGSVLAALADETGDGVSALSSGIPASTPTSDAPASGSSSSSASASPVPSPGSSSTPGSPSSPTSGSPSSPTSGSPSASGSSPASGSPSASASSSSSSVTLAPESDATVTGTVDLTTCTAETDSKNRTYYHLIFTQGTVSIHVYVYRSSSVPAMFISTSQGIDWIESNKENRDTGCSMTMIENDGSTVYSGKLSEMKGRGNSTWSCAKKPYQIKLSKKSELVDGAGSAKTWVLLANAVDESQMRSWLAYDVGQFAGLSFTPCGRPVDLYVDGTYRGAYYLCEKVQTGSNRVEIADLEGANEDVNEGTDLGSLPATTLVSTDGTAFSPLSAVSYVPGFASPSDITGGYLIEGDQYYYSTETTWFRTSSGACFSVKSPEIANEDEVVYLSSFIRDTEEALASPTGYNSKGKHFSEYIDMDSFAKMFAVQELVGNYDFFCSSMYYYKDSDKNGVTGKLYAGPLWDMDSTLGSIGSWLQLSDAGVLLENASRNPSSAWLGYLLQHPEFKAAVAQAYASLMPEVQSLLGGDIDSYAATIADSSGMDDLRWSVYKAAGALPYNGSCNDVGDHSGAIANMTSILSARSASLEVDAQLGAYTLPSGYHTVTIDANLSDVTSNSPWFQTGGRATVRVEDAADLDLIARWTEGGVEKDVALIATGETGLLSFTMPDADVTVLAGTVEQPTYSIGYLSPVVYTGSAATPTVTVYAPDGTTVDPAQYTVFYADNIEVGTASVTVTGNGNGFDETVTGSFPIVFQGTYRIASCLDASSAHVLGIVGASTSAGARLAIFPTDAGDAQIFDVSYGSDGTYTIRDHYSGLALDVAGGLGASTPAGTSVLQWTASAATNQKWLIERVDGTEAAGTARYRLVSVDSGMALDISGGSLSRGNKTCVWKSNGGANQCFRFIPATPSAASSHQSPGSYHDYMIALGSDDSLVFDISGDSPFAGAALELWTRNETGTAADDNQIFRLTALGGGYYTIRALNSYKMLDVSGGLGDATASGTPVCQWYQTGGANQKWICDTLEDGTCRFVSVDSGLYLTVPGTPAAGSHLTVAQEGSGNQTFSLTAAKYVSPVADGTYTLDSLSNGGQAVDVAGVSVEEMANVETWTRNEGANQHFKIIDAGGGLYTIMAVNSEMYLDTPEVSPVAGSNVAQYKPSGKTGQLWFAVSYGDGSYAFLQASSGLALDVAGGLAYDGANLDVWSVNDGTNQRFIPATAGLIPCGTYAIASVVDSSKVLDITGNSVVAGGNVELWTRIGNQANQTFRLNTTTDGSYTITAISSGMVLDVAQAGTASGTNVLQWPGTGAANQLWRIVDAGDGCVSFVSCSNGLYLGIAPGRQAFDGDNIAVWTADGSDAQRFKIEP